LVLLHWKNRPPDDVNGAEGGGTGENKVACEICCDDYPAEEYGGKVGALCDHRRTSCKNCVQRHIHEELTGKGNALLIKCLEAGCNVALEYMDVQAHASREDFERYDALLIKQTLQGMAEFRWCSRVGCGSGQLVEGAGEPHQCKPLWLFAADRRRVLFFAMRWCGRPVVGRIN
jgi:hypothetical protein